MLNRLFVFFLFILMTASLEAFFLPEGSSNGAIGQTVCVQVPVKMTAHWSCTHPQRFLPGVKSKAERAEIRIVLKRIKQAQALLKTGDLFVDMDDYIRAEQTYRQVLKLQPDMTVGWIKLAKFYSDLDREEDALQILHNGLQQTADTADIYYEMGLLQVRLKILSQAIVSLAKAARLAPENPYYSYVYGIALNSYQHTDEALVFLHQAYQRHPDNKEILQALIAINQDNHNNSDALSYAETLLELEPDNPSLQALVAQLKAIAQPPN